MKDFKTVQVSLKDGGYPVFCGSQIWDNADVWKDNIGGGKVALITNKTIMDLHGEKVSAKLEEILSRFIKPIVINDGEQYKTWKTVGEILEQLAKFGMHRDGTIIALGGGVIGDIAGFVAATYMRGIRVIQIPTTLLAQVDAAIGGKTGVNSSRGKNLFGAFHQPAAVLCDTDFLSTLPEREYYSGLAEVVKYALLGDKEFFGWLENNAEDLTIKKSAAICYAVEKSVQMKADIVVADEREISGRRVLLNLGHTFAHAVENVAGYGEWLHGEAVAAGLVAAAKLSEKASEKNIFIADDTKRIVTLLKRFNLPTSFSRLDNKKIRAAMQMDKKFTAAEIRFVLMDSIGAASLCHFSDMSKVDKILEEMQ
ncbi:MAG: 3-dehydroquinate synthase [Gammaproteobacteria bacterium WSBS_2016_MAG_OTU1]